MSKDKDEQKVAVKNSQWQYYFPSLGESLLTGITRAVNGFTGAMFVGTTILIVFCFANYYKEHMLFFQMFFRFVPVVIVLLGGMWVYDKIEQFLYPETKRYMGKNLVVSEDGSKEAGVITKSSMS